MASGDPGSEFVRRQKTPPASSSGSGNATAAAGAGAGAAAGGRRAPAARTPAMPPMQETMQLIFSPDKREGTCAGTNGGWARC